MKPVFWAPVFECLAVFLLAGWNLEQLARSSVAAASGLTMCGKHALARA